MVTNIQDTEPSQEQPIAGDIDPLLTCLMLIAKTEGRVVSKSTLLAGLPLVKEKLTPKLFIRAAERAELSAHIVQQPLEKLLAVKERVILLMKDDKVCLFIADNKDSGTYSVILPEHGDASVTVNLDTLTADYSGYAILVEPLFQFKHSTDKLIPQQGAYWFWKVIHQNRSIYYEVLMASFLINLFALATPLFIMNVYDRVVPNQSAETLWVLATGVGIVIIFDFILRMLRIYFIDEAGKNVDTKLSSAIFEHILGLKMGFSHKSVGVLANTVGAFEAFRDFITSATISTLIDVPFSLLFLVVIGLIGGTLVWVPIICIPIILIISLIVQIPLINNLKELFRYSAERNSTLVESLSAVETIKSLAIENAMQKRWEHAIKNAADLSVEIRFLSNVGVNISVFAQTVATIAVVIWGVYKIFDGELTVGALVACTILAGRSLACMVQISGLMARYFQSVTGLKALNIIMQSEVDRPKGKHFIHREHINGSIDFANVDFHYPEQKTNVLTRCSFHIEKGEKVAIIGRVGSGKSTIEKLLVGLYEASSGNILIDDTDIRQLDPAELRRHIAYVPQDIVLFDGTLKDNILLTRTADEQALLHASSISGVARFVNKHPEGFDLRVGERGAYLSAGQRQSVAIARALLLKPSILLFDEPTSFMDDGSEATFKASLSTQYADKTLILVTHSASLLSLVDRIIILDAGHIAADGPREHVISALAAGKLGKIA